MQPSAAMLFDGVPISGTTHSMSYTPNAAKESSRARLLARAILSVVLNVVALLLLMVGLIAPLTPSEGVPSVTALAAFAGGPVVLLVLATAAASSRAARVLIATECCLVLVFLTALIARLLVTSA